MNGANKECLFLFVYTSVSSKPELNRETCILCPNALRDAQQEGPVYTAISACLCQHPHTSQISKTVRVVARHRNKKLLISPGQEWAKQALCQPRIALWLFCVGHDWFDTTGLGFTAKIVWTLVIDYRRWGSSPRGLRLAGTWLKIFFLDRRGFKINMLFHVNHRVEHIAHFDFHWAGLNHLTK